MSRTFDHVREELRESLFRMAGRSEAILDKAVKSFENHDVVRATEVKRDDLEIDRLDVEIDREVLQALALHAPVGEELRTVIAAKMTANELERIGDLARNIAKATIRLAGRSDVFVPEGFDRLAILAQVALQRSLDALSRGDASLARQVLDEDDLIDEAEDQVILSSLEEISKKTESAPQVVDLILVARHLERVGDHATNIAEQVILVEEARNVKHISKIQ
ncbi:MAG: phosphate signaling complex protein PhoU [Deltaproteobacteria bacterium]|nr:phosphate signaling complex protein PhoU [Deltaproteobacteria bacterium]